MKTDVAQVLRRLRITDSRYVEIESKRRVVPEQAKALREHLLGRRDVRHKKSAFFFDQYLDTPEMDVFRLKASLRLRYKRNGAFVYLQYKGPGFLQDGVLFRSEFSTERLRHILKEESHHDIVHFAETSFRDIFTDHVPPPMAEAMRRHLGPKIVKRLSAGPILCAYQKDKFEVDLGSAYLEPSLDRIFAFHIGRKGPHPLSTFCEFENEIKAADQDPFAKLEHLDDMLKFETSLEKRFDLRPERLDKYHRCASFFIAAGR